MKKIIVFLACVLLLINANSCLAAITQEDLAVNGVRLLSSRYEDVLAKFGEPKRKSADENGQPPLTHLAYAGFHASVVSDTGKLVYMMVDNSDYSTIRGVKVGATPYKVIQAYGQPQKMNLRGHIYYVYNTEPAGDTHLIFDMTEGYASKIIFTNLPLD